MAFNHPEAFWLLLAVPVFALLAFILTLRDKAIRNRFASRELFEQLTRSMSKQKRLLRTVSYFGGLFFLVLALTGPRFGTKTEIIKRMGVDVVIVLDTSYSMLAEDVKPSRIGQSKYEIGRLIDNLKGDRVALVVFAGDAFIQCPLTTDYGAAKTLLDYVDAGVVPIPGTDIGKALTLAYELLKKDSQASGASQMVLLVTDGESIGGDPDGASRKLAQEGIKVYTVGIGTTGGEIIPIRNDQGHIEDYKKDSRGNIVKTMLDEKTLRNIAEITGGTYLPAVRGEVDVQELIDELGSMHKTDIHERKISRLKERYQLLLGISLVFILVWFTLGERRKMTFRGDMK